MLEKESLEFFGKLIECISPSGFEEEAVATWKMRTKAFADTIERDVHGNCIALMQPGKTPRIMLAGHIDEIGYMVKYIDEQGYLYFSSVGGIDLHLLPGQRVWIKGRHGTLLGVIGRKPIHLLEEEERRKVVKIEQLWIDIGAVNDEEAKTMVEIGDVAVPAVGFEILQGDMVIGRGFDDKAGAFVVSETLRLLKGETFTGAVYGVATVQEEIGLRGAQTSAYGISPDIGIAVDVTFATDFPGMDKKRTGEIKLGKGPVIARGPNINSKVFELLVNAATKENIPYQVEGVSRGTGTDANVIQLTKAGVATGLVSIPLRYMHTPVEMVHLQDVINAARLLRAFVVNYHGQAMFTA
jgi:endoglucanase